MNNRIFSEEEQRTLFIKQYCKEKTLLYCEVPVFCRSVDLVKYNSIDETISAIEFKTNNWRRAIDQVLRVSMSFDFLEICVLDPKTEKSRNSIIETCTQLGIGLYLFNQEYIIFNYIVTPEKVQKIWEIQKNQVLDYLLDAKIYE